MGRGTDKLWRTTEKGLTKRPKQRRRNVGYWIKKNNEHTFDEKIITPIRALRCTGEGSIRQLSLNRVKRKVLSQIYFRPRFNKIPTKTKNIFKYMVLTTYLKFSIPIAIQQLTKYRGTEAKRIEILTSICKTIYEIDNKIHILVWYSKVENTVRLLKSIDLAKSFSKKIVNDEYVETLQIG